MVLENKKAVPYISENAEYSTLSLIGTLVWEKKEINLLCVKVIMFSDCWGCFREVVILWLQFVLLLNAWEMLNKWFEW